MKKFSEHDFLSAPLIDTLSALLNLNYIVSYNVRHNIIIHTITTVVESAATSATSVTGPGAKTAHAPLYAYYFIVIKLHGPRVFPVCVCVFRNTTNRFGSMTCITKKIVVAQIGLGDPALTILLSYRPIKCPIFHLSIPTHPPIFEVLPERHYYPVLHATTRVPDITQAAIQQTIFVISNSTKSYTHFWCWFNKQYFWKITHIFYRGTDFLWSRHAS